MQKKKTLRSCFRTTRITRARAGTRTHTHTQCSRSFLLSISENIWVTLFIYSFILLKRKSATAESQKRRWGKAIVCRARSRIEQYYFGLNELVSFLCQRKEMDVNGKNKTLSICKHLSSLSCCCSYQYALPKKTLTEKKRLSEIGIWGGIYKNQTFSNFCLYWLSSYNFLCKTDS